MLGPATNQLGTNGYWCWGGGVIWVGPGGDNGVKLADISAPALRGDRTLLLSSTEWIAIGSTVRIIEYETSGTLGRFLHAFAEAFGISGFLHASWGTLGRHLHAGYFDPGTWSGNF